VLKPTASVAANAQMRSLEFSHRCAADWRAAKEAEVSGPKED